MKDWQKEAIEEGIASAERGELTPLDQVKVKWETMGAVEVVIYYREDYSVFITGYAPESLFLNEKETTL